MQLQPGTRIRDFEVLRLIGEGGMGEVYLGRDITLGREVAIKRLNPLFTQDPEFSERFINEARIQAKLTHANIVILHSFFHDNGVWYMILEYAPGITLRELILRTGPIPEKRALNILGQVAEALAYAHAKNIIHRDVKPGNIMVDTAHGDTVKVMDFGIARVLSEGHLTRTGTKMGTPYYMSPEQVNALKDVDQRSDVYSAGVVLYEMLSGKLPFNLDTDSDLLIPYRIVHDPLPDPRLVYEHISQATIDLLNRITIKDRQQRPASLLDSIRERGKPAQNDYQPIIPEVHPPIINNQQTPTTETEDTDSLSDFEPAASISDTNMDSDNQLEHKQKSSTRKWLIALLLAIVLPYVIYIIIQHKHNDSANGEQPAPELDMVLVQNLNVSHGFRPAPITPYDLLVSNCEVTQAEWQYVMGDNPSSYQSDPSSDYHPVESISWYQAIDYCNKRSQVEGLNPCYKSKEVWRETKEGAEYTGDEWVCDWEADGYRLLTKTEWNYLFESGNPSPAASATDAQFKPQPRMSIGLFFPVSGCKKRTEEEIRHSVVGYASSNSYGIYDMDGNVSEWCWDGDMGNSFYGSSNHSAVPQVASGSSGFDKECVSPELGLRVVRLGTSPSPYAK